MYYFVTPAMNKIPVLVSNSQDYDFIDYNSALEN
jgi:hypothetical protein